MRVRIRLLISVVVLGFGSVASASNLVQNGGFESNDFSHWSGTAAADVGSNGVTGSIFGIDPFQGSYQAIFATYTAETLTQTLATTFNGSETISFALADGGGGSPTDSFKVYFGGNLLATLSQTSGSYQTYSYQATATSTSTDLSFTMAHPSGGDWFLDAVSVTETVAAVPEPSTLALACVACVSGLGHAAFRRRKAKLAA